MPFKKKKSANNKKQLRINLHPEPTNPYFPSPPSSEIAESSYMSRINSSTSLATPMSATHDHCTVCQK